MTVNLIKTQSVEPVEWLSPSNPTSICADRSLKHLRTLCAQLT